MIKLSLSIECCFEYHSILKIIYLHKSNILINLMKMKYCQNTPQLSSFPFNSLL